MELAGWSASALGLDVVAKYLWTSLRGLYAELLVDVLTGIHPFIIRIKIPQRSYDDYVVHRFRNDTSRHKLVSYRYAF